MRPQTYAMMEFVEWLAINYSASVTSWWRSRAHNATPAMQAQGSRPNSLHLSGDAIDVVYDDPGAAPPLNVLASVAALYDCRIRREKSHDHIEPAKPWARPRSSADAGYLPRTGPEVLPPGGGPERSSGFGEWSTGKPRFVGHLVGPVHTYAEQCLVCEGPCHGDAP